MWKQELCMAVHVALQRVAMADAVRCVDTCSTLRFLSQNHACVLMMHSYAVFILSEESLSSVGSRCREPSCCIFPMMAGKAEEGSGMTVVHLASLLGGVAVAGSASRSRQQVPVII